MINITYKECLDNFYLVLLDTYEDFYEYYKGTKGALLLAFILGKRIKRLPITEQKNAIQSSYSIICVRYYNLKPPIDAKEWFQEIYTSINKV